MYPHDTSVEIDMHTAISRRTWLAITIWTVGQMFGVSAEIQRTSIYHKNHPVTYFPVGTPQAGNIVRCSFRVNDVKRQGKFPSNGFIPFLSSILMLDPFSAYSHLRFA